MTQLPPSDGSTSGRLVPFEAAHPIAPRANYGGPVGGYYGADPTVETAEGAFNVREFFRIIASRKWLILSTLAAVLALAVVRTMLQVPLYTSTARLQIDRNVAKIVDSGNITPAEVGGDADFLRTQYELLQSRALAERVVTALNLGDEPEFIKPQSFSVTSAVMGLINPAASKSDPGRAARDRQAVSVIMTNRQVRPVTGSRLVDVTFSDPSPQVAQRVTAAISEAFIASTLDKRFQANSYAKTFLEDQIKQLKLRLEDSEKLMLEFAQREQIVTATDKSSIAENNLAAANQALGNLVSERIKNEQLWKQVDQSRIVDLPQLLSNTVIDGLRGRRNALTTEYQEKLETFKPSYPAMVQLDNKIKEIDRQLASEVRTVKGSFKGAYEASLKQEEEMKVRIEGLRAEYLDLQKRSIQYNILKREVDTNRGLYDSLLQRYKEVDVAAGAGTNNVFLVEKPVAANSPSSPRLSIALMLGSVLGLFFGLVAAFGMEWFDDAVRSQHDIERLIGLPVLGVIPKIKTNASVEDTMVDPRSAVAEAYRSLCTALQFSTDNGVPKTLFITSSGPGEGKSSSALAIARHFATTGLRVLLIDGDLRNPSIHTKAGLPNVIGLSNYLTGACTPPEAMQASSVPSLAIMTSGPLPPNAADLLGSARLASMLTVGTQLFDLIIIDGPPVMGLADAPLFSSVAAGTLYVTASGQARKRYVRETVRRLRLARAPLVGVVLTKVDLSSASYGYGYGYGGGYEYGAASPSAIANDKAAARS